MPVNGGAGHFFGQARRQPTGACDVSGLGPDGVHAAEDHVFHGGGVDPRAVHQGREYVGAKIGGMGLGKRSLLAAGRGANGVDDIGLGHDWDSLWGSVGWGC